MGRAAGIWPESCLSHREGANVSDFKNVSRCSKVKVKIECMPLLVFLLAAFFTCGYNSPRCRWFAIGACFGGAASDAWRKPAAHPPVHVLGTRLRARRANRAVPVAVPVLGTRLQMYCAHHAKPNYKGPGAPGAGWFGAVACFLGGGGFICIVQKGALWYLFWAGSFGCTVQNGLARCLFGHAASNVLCKA